MLQPGWEWGLGRIDTCIHMAESLCCSPETITALLISSTPIQNKMLKNNYNNNQKKKKKLIEREQICGYQRQSAEGG